MKKKNNSQPQPPRCDQTTPALLSRCLSTQTFLHAYHFSHENLCMEDEPKDTYRFNSCHFDHIGCQEAWFTESEFLDCVFTACDFSGIDLSRSRFFRCRFEGCRFVGTTFYECMWKDVCCSNCSLNYANFGGSHFERCQFLECSIKDGGFIHCQQKHLSFSSCDLQACAFTNTALADIHLESDRIDGITVSEESLRGVYVSPTQAIALIALLGIHVVEETW